MSDDGSQLVASGGGYMSTLTNLNEPSKTVDISSFGRGEILFKADGTVSFRLAGQALTAVTGEAAMMGLDPGIYLIEGRLEILYDEDFRSPSDHEDATRAGARPRLRHRRAEAADREALHFKILPRFAAVSASAIARAAAPM